ncbi:MAG: hypothetical protein IPK71_20595 [Myxococcales bacterium]|nr:hypothetical protein [Myxococcales bacterium]
MDAAESALTGGEHGRGARSGPRTSRAVWALVLAAGLAVAPGVAHAEGPSASDEAKADALFQRANERVAKRDFAAACPLFEEAYHLAGGGGTAQNLATCLEDLGKLAAAYHAFAELKRVSLPAGRAARVKLAEERMAKLEARVPRVRVRLAAELRSPETLVTVDGDTYGEKAIEAGVPVDVGAHVVKVMVPGRAPLEASVTLQREGQIETVELPRVAAGQAKASGAPASPDDAESSRAAVRTAGLVVGGVGAVSLVVGGVFGVLTATTAAAARAACRDSTEGLTLSNKGPTDDPRLMFDASGRCYTSTPDRPNPYYEDSQRLTQNARGYGTIATIMVPVGIAGVVAGVYMILTTRTDRAEPKTARAARLVPTPFGVTLAGEFQ